MKSKLTWIRLRGMAGLRVPVFVHWSVFVPVGVAVICAITSPIYGALFLFSYLAIIVAHELGHAFVARRLGYHVEAIGITALHGWCSYEAPYSEWHEVLVAWGGVAAQLAIALPVLLVTLALGDRDWSYFTPIVVFLGYINVVIAAINLVPGDNSDGTVAWRLIPILLQERRAKRTTRNRPVGRK